MTKLWSIDGGVLSPLSIARLTSEDRLEGWLASDIGLLNPELLLIGRQVITPHGGRIDLLAITAEGALSVIELKRDRTPRDIVAQILDYASWVARLDTPAIHDLANDYWRGKSLSFAEAFRRKFDTAPPEPLNSSHSMVIVASSLDPSSQRIVEYLSQTHDVGINTAFFTLFGDGERQYLSADWLMDHDDVVERTEKKVRTPWTGYKYVNVGQSDHRSWADMREYGFVAAGHGPQWSSQLVKRLAVDDRIYAYQKSSGYVGFGRVTETAVMVRDVLIDGKPLLDHPLTEPGLAHDSDDPDLAEYAARVDWIRTFDLNGAKTFSGAFASTHIVCKLSDPATLSFLESAFL